MLPESSAYRIWRRRFMLKRQQLGLQIAVVAYLTFILLDLIQTALGLKEWDPTWLAMACLAELGLTVCLWLCRTRWGRRRPELIFLGASWSITLTEQFWATLQGFAFPGLYAWTLVFLAQATLIPVFWRLHLISQLGLIAYYFSVNSAIALHPPDQPLWDPILVLYVFWFCCICCGSVYLYERLQRAEFSARRELEAEQQKSERLLLNILPEAVAQQLKQEHRTIAESFPNVTVLFADIVDFTQLSSGVPAAELVELLNQIFSEFDRLVEKHGLEKIKTIGDAYMVVGGLPLERDDHIEAIADIALDMQQVITQFKTNQGKPFNIRIGINTGPVVAGVIGTKKFIYDLWGDTVNVASRMESHGQTGCIQVTVAVYQKLRDRYVFEDRGSIHIKGKGNMTTYWLQGKRQRFAATEAADLGPR